MDSTQAHPSTDAKISLAEAAEHAGVTRNTIWRWIKDGFGVNGQVIHLKHDRLGRQFRTTVRWLDEFAADIARAGEQEASRESPTPIAHQSASDAACRQEGL